MVAVVVVVLVVVFFWAAARWVGWVGRWRLRWYCGYLGGLLLGCAVGVRFVGVFGGDG